MNFNGLNIVKGFITNDLIALKAMSLAWVDGTGGSGGGCCLVCLVALPRRPLQATPIKFEDRKPVDLFIKMCELLNVSFSEIQQDWQQDFQNNKLPFCSNCLKGKFNYKT